MTEENRRIETWGELEAIIGELLGEMPNLDDFFSSILNKGLCLISAPSGFLALQEEKGEELIIHASTQEARKGQRFAITDSLVGQVVERRVLLNVPDVRAEPYASYKKPMLGQRNVSALAVPIKVDDQVIGVLAFESPRGNAFNSQHQHQASVLALLAAVAIRQHRILRGAKQREKLAVEARFAAEVVHRLNNPMGAIRAWVLQAELDQEAVINQHPDLKQALVHIKVNAEKATALVRELREKLLEPETKTIELGKCLQSALESVEIPSIVEVRKQIFVEPTLVRANEQLTHVFVNLITNAVEAMPHGGYLEIGSRLEGDFVEAWVQDTGIGIPPELITEVFKGYFTTKANDQGHHGLGLYWVKHYIEAFGGETRLESGVGIGTKVIVRFPLASMLQAESTL